MSKKKPNKDKKEQSQEFLSKESDPFSGEDIIDELFSGYNDEFSQFNMI